MIKQVLSLFIVTVVYVTQVFCQTSFDYQIKCKSCNKDQKFNGSTFEWPKHFDISADHDSVRLSHPLYTYQLVESDSFIKLFDMQDDMEHYYGLSKMQMEYLGYQYSYLSNDSLSIKSGLGCYFDRIYNPMEFLFELIGSIEPCQIVTFDSTRSDTIERIWHKRPSYELMFAETYLYDSNQLYQVEIESESSRLQYHLYYDNENRISRIVLMMQYEMHEPRFIKSWKFFYHKKHILVTYNTRYYDHISKYKIFLSGGESFTELILNQHDLFMVDSTPFENNFEFWLPDN